ncbi:hypothetical protein GIB67_016424 [Kingdonia uniflora]|uniref:ABC-2 type transporter transmembrane domain-containing protein n=1 Tax=Kingdonia uniflora TaxID=39325 RepID=A0A7J7MH82_9MAGN|nr:hypothetical protein GIB67_016424 [Kingdonia uniflora]
MIAANTFDLFAILVVLGGFDLSRDNAKKWWLWGYWTSPMMYAQNALEVNEFLGKSWSRVLPNFTETLEVREFLSLVDYLLKRIGVPEDRLLLLKNVSGAFRLGVLTALMGASGAENWNLWELARLPREFCFEDLKTVTNDFPNKLGSSGSGSVFKVVLEDGTPIAVKRVERLQMIETGRASFIVYDLLPNGLLDTWIFTRMGGSTGQFLSQSWRMKVALEVA